MQLTHKSYGQYNEQSNTRQLFETTQVLVSQYSEILAGYQANLVHNKLL